MNSAPLEDYGGRRFILAVAALLICSILRACNLLTDGGYVTVIMGTVATYIGAGTFEAHSQIRADVQKTVAAAQVQAAPSDVVEQVPK